jgi:hypothetical protein
VLSVSRGGSLQISGAWSARRPRAGGKAALRPRAAPLPDAAHRG